MALQDLDVLRIKKLLIVANCSYYRARSGIVARRRFLEPIETQFTMGSYHYTQLERRGTLAIYEQRHKDNPKVIRYEVIRIRIQRAHAWPNGVMTPEKEAYPGSYAWGHDGHTCFTLAEAQALVAQLARRSDV